MTNPGLMTVKELMLLRQRKSCEPTREGYFLHRYPVNPAVGDRCQCGVHELEEDPGCPWDGT